MTSIWTEEIIDSLRNWVNLNKFFTRSARQKSILLLIDDGFEAPKIYDINSFYK